MNEHFLDAELFIDQFLGPMSPFKDKVGVLIFEFSRFYPSDFERGRQFVEALDAFLSKLPSGWQYGVEIRNPGFLKPTYFECLGSHNVAHVFNSWAQMPSIPEQMALAGCFTTDFFAARFLLRPGRSYQNAVDAFSPYNSAQDPYPEARRALWDLANRPAKRPSFIFVNNRFEGDAILTIRDALSTDQAE